MIIRYAVISVHKRHGEQVAHPGLPSVDAARNRIAAYNRDLTPGQRAGIVKYIIRRVELDSVPWEGGATS